MDSSFYWALLRKESMKLKIIETSLTEIKRENNENKTELAIPSVGEDGQQQGFQFITDANAK